MTTKEENWHLGHCLGLEVVGQGKTIEETQVNLKEAVELYLESFGPDDQPQSLGEVMIYPLEVSVGVQAAGPSYRSIPTSARGLCWQS